MLASFQGSYAYSPGMRTRLYLVAMGFVVDGITYKGSKHIANCVTGQNLSDSTVMQILKYNDLLKSRATKPAYRLQKKQTSSVRLKPALLSEPRSPQSQFHPKGPFPPPKCCPSAVLDELVSTHTQCKHLSLKMFYL